MDVEVRRLTRENRELQSMLDKCELHMSEIRSNVKILTQENEKTRSLYEQVSLLLLPSSIPLPSISPLSLSLSLYLALSIYLSISLSLSLYPLSLSRSIYLSIFLSSISSILTYPVKNKINIHFLSISM